MIILINGAYRQENDSYARRLIEQGIAVAAPETEAAHAEELTAEPAEEPAEEPKTDTRKSRKK